jgi:DNA-3-methyladenine glycosylase
MPPPYGPPMPAARRDFYHTDSVTLARRLLGCRLVRELPRRPSANGAPPARLVATIVETEAYLGAEDAAAHSYRLRRTDRNESMYGPPGTAYIYFTYGMHHCFNIVCGEENEPVAVLIRAAAPIDGIAHMRRRRAAGHRGRSRREGPLAPMPDRDLCRGPARLCEAFGIDRRHDGLDLAAGRPLWIEPGAPAAPRAVITAPRVGVAYAGDWAHRPFRFLLKADPHISVRPPRHRKTSVTSL